MNLNLEFRPQRFGDIVGQPWVSMVLQNMVAQDDVPEVLIFHGSRGTGKTSTARILGAALNCEAEDRPCMQCGSCVSIRKGGSVDVIEIDAATNGRAEDMRRLCDMLTYDVGSRNRVVILDEAHGVSGAGFDVMLKTLEEPPARVTFILVTTEPEQLPDTIHSRLRVGKFRFKPITLRHIADRLRAIRDAKGLAVDDEVIAYIAERADGGMRDAIGMLDQAGRAGAGTLEKFYALTGESDFAPALIDVMMSGRLGELYDMADALVYDVGDPQLITARLVRCLRDLLVLRAGGATVTAQGEGLRQRQKLAQRASDVQLVGALRVLWDLQKVRNAADQRTLLDLSLVMCAEQFAPVKQQAAAAGGNGHRPATIEDIKALAGA